MKGRIVIVLLLCLADSAFSQVNLVRNPDFETYTFCPTANDQISAAKYWTGIDSIGFKSCAADYCHTCVKPPNHSNNVPESRFYWQYPRSGNGMAQVGMYYNNSSTPNLQIRTYLQGRLYRKLNSGMRYCVAFYVSLIEVSGYAVKEISAYLDNGSIDTTRFCGEPQTRYNPQVTHTGGIITDTMRWTKIEGSFVANGTEQFITIGNFRDNAHTSVVTMQIDPKFSGNGKEYAAYLIDDVSVIESDLPAYAGPDTHVGKGDSVYIGRPHEVGLECTWRVLGSTAVIGTGAGIWVKPAVTTRYVVTQTLCGAVTRDTVRVEVWGVGVKGTQHEAQQYSLSPNPGQGLIELRQSLPSDGAAGITLYNMLGQSLYTSTVFFRNARASVDVREFVPPGIYYLNIRDAQGRVATLRYVRQ